MPTIPTQNRQWRLRSRPVGLIRPENFELVTTPVPTLKDGEFLVRSLLLSLDPAMRGWLEDRPSYLPPVGIGEVMRGLVVGVVEESRHADFAPGDHVQGSFGWQDFAVVTDGKGVTKLPADNDDDGNGRLPLEAFLGLFGIAGQTAYFGLLDVGQPKEGETLLVSGAAGSVGSLVGQIGKIKGLHVVGVAGSPEKCRWLTDELGFDAAVDYKEAASPDGLRARLKDACPRGVDVYFENVGGETLDTVLGLMNPFGRVALCGLISQYNATDAVPGPVNFPMVLTKRLRVQGFIMFDFAARAAKAVRDLGRWHAEGRLRYRVDVVPGLENAPTAINKLFDGSNRGKLIVRL